MSTYDYSVSIDAPADVVWKHISDVAHWPDWTDSVRKVEPLDTGELAVGHKARVFQPKLPKAVWTVTAIEPGRSFTWVNKTPGLTSTGIHSVVPTADGSQATLTLEQHGLLAPLVRLLTGKMTQRYVELEGNGLKRVSEST
jgi:ligand-binding SRPBCC domain-containing protein